ncbi:MAG: discoidin domain-containing protein [Eubacteriales bacterium]|nr:discoidin domain-containing protein [Eubacteriales bacterium]
MKRLISIILSIIIFVSIIPIASAEGELTENLCLTSDVLGSNEGSTLEGGSTRAATLGADSDLSTFWLGYLSTVTITECPWYMVDLGDVYSIATIKLQGRRDTNKSADRKNFEVQLSNIADFSEYIVVGSQGSSSYTYKEYWTCDVNESAKYRYVRIIKTAKENLSVSEFEVYAQAISKPIAYDPSVSGTPVVDQYLTANYTFAYDGEHEDESSSYVWYSSDDSQGLVNPVKVQDSNSKQYKVTSADVGKYISCDITPACSVNGEIITGLTVKGINGKIVRANATDPVGFIYAPAMGDVYNMNETISLSVDAESGDAQISKVEYFIDGVKYSEVTEAPFNSSYVNATLGDHSVYAVITNSLGVSITTASVSFNVSESKITYDKIGTTHKRNAKEIDCDWLSIGCECLDRDMAIYDNYKEYLGELGVTKARIQGGWAKCEKEKGVYDWAWLDAVVYDMAQRGVTPWINTCYGNDIYEGGGGTTLSGGLPYSDEALAAWDKWVEGMVTRYKDVVGEWEVWNEADHGDANTMSDYVTFFIRTSDIIKRVDPDAKVIGLASASTASTTLKSFMNAI